MKLRILTIFVLCCYMFLCGCGREESGASSSRTPQEGLTSSETSYQPETDSINSEEVPASLDDTEITEISTLLDNSEELETLDNANDAVDESTQPANIQEGVLSGIKIGIDPGHQQYANTDPETIAPNSTETKYKVTGGAQGVSTGIPEYVTVLDISKKLRDKLEAEGAEVYMTRETHDVDISNQERAKMMNEYGVDLMLRVHCDSAENSSKQGIALYVSQSNSIAEISREYAEIILPYVTDATGANNNGIVQNDNYTGQNWAEVPCMMIECGFVSNPSEDELLNSNGYQEMLTDGILQGIIACFDPTYVVDNME